MRRTTFSSLEYISFLLFTLSDPFHSRPQPPALLRTPWPHCWAEAGNSKWMGGFEGLCHIVHSQNPRIWSTPKGPRMKPTQKKTQETNIKHSSPCALSPAQANLALSPGCKTTDLERPLRASLCEVELTETARPSFPFFFGGKNS